MNKLPEALLSDLETVNGFERPSFIAAHQEAPVTSVRLHPVKPGGDFGETERIPWCESGRYLKERPVFTLDPAYHAGAYYVQEASSMFLDYLVRSIYPERKGLRVLDLCGAPGGKTTLLASLLDKESLLISNEVIRSRASILEENSVRWGYTNTWITSNDPKNFGQLEGYFDLIVTDAPCSGSGLFRKDLNALNEWSEASVHLCSQRQQRIIADVWNALKEDGIFIYATCSYSPQEDEDIIDWLSENFSVQSVPVNVPAEWCIVTTETKNKLICYRFFPDRVRGEGFFIAAIRKKDPTGNFHYPKYKSLHDAKGFQKASYLLNRNDLVCIAGKDSFHAINKDHEADFHFLHKQLFFRKTGLALGLPSAKEWLPAHDVALSVDKAQDIPSLDLNREQSLRFLKKEELILPLQEKGWLLVTYNGPGLGWMKSLGNRFNNYLPKHWRIRMALPEEG